jgi:hypothetical protein
VCQKQLELHYTQRPSVSILSLFLFRRTIGSYYRVRHLADFIPYITCMFCIDSSGVDIEQITTVFAGVAGRDFRLGADQSVSVV